MRRILLSLVTLWGALPAYADGKLFGHAEIHPVIFKNIPPTLYTIGEEILTAKVARSASALLIPFSQVQRPQRLQFEWQSSESIPGKTSANEITKAGDDFLLRIGLCLKGTKPWIPFFAPSWIKLIEEKMHLPTKSMTYYVVGAKHKSTDHWRSPYADSIETIAVDSTSQANGWNKVDFDLKQPLEVVGIWMMADGDDTQANFELNAKGFILQ